MNSIASALRQPISSWFEYTVVLSRQSVLMFSLLIGLFALSLASLTLGAVPISVQDVVLATGYQMGLYESISTPAYEVNVLFNIRLPRMLLGILVGGCLGICGAAMQALFRNPLAEPTLVGVSSGAALAAVAITFFTASITSVFGPMLLIYLTPIAAFLGGLVTSVMVYLLATRESRTDMAVMILAGIAVNALAGAGIGLFVFASDDQQVRQILFWLFGSLGGALWQTLLPSIVPIVAAMLVIVAYRYPLNLYLLGEREAGHIGVNVQRMKWILISAIALGVGSSVALSGMIGFVGLVVPHLIRLCTGPDNRFLIPASALLGAILLLGADSIARTVVAPVEIPIGLVTSLIGSPFFLYLLVQQRRRWRV